MRVPFSVPTGGPVRSGLVLGGLVAGGLAAVAAFGALPDLGSSRGRLGALRTAAGRDQLLVVPGYRSPGRRANGLNHFRVRAGLRSIDPAARSALMIFCGGPVAGPVPE